MKPLRRQDAAAAQRKPFLMPIRKSGHWKMLYLDFETRSECDLTMAGAYVYSRHPTTRILCAAYSIDDDKLPRIWLAAMRVWGAT